MLEALFLLLPIALIYGWYLGRQSILKQDNDSHSRFAKDYIKGLNLLFNKQHEKAVDVFLAILQRPESNDLEQNNLQNFEIKMTLANLFRSRGELDKAIGIHQTLEQSSNLSKEQMFLVKQELAKDFMFAGFYDRAESYYLQLVNEPNFAQYSLEQLVLIYQKMREWDKAINTFTQISKFNKTNDLSIMAQFYCEQAEKIVDNDENQFFHLLNLALNNDANCARANILLGDFYLSKKQFNKALQHYQNILEQNCELIIEVTDKLKACYNALNDWQNYELFLIKTLQKINHFNVLAKLAELVSEKYGVESAQKLLFHYLGIQPDLRNVQLLIYYIIKQNDNFSGKNNLDLIYRILDEQIKNKMLYQCNHCGLESKQLNWLCPACNKWQKSKPITNLENK